MKKKWTEKSDDAADRKAGIKEGSKRDQELDRKRGLPPSVVRKGVKPNTVKKTGGKGPNVARPGAKAPAKGPGRAGPGDTRQLPQQWAERQP